LDAASNNSVDDIRNLIEQVRIIPQQGRYSVFVIDEVHMLSTNAFNAFLKTLEEPPQHAIFILATTEKHKIIPTILSRCQIYDFNRIRIEDGVEYLRYIADKEGVTADDEALNLIAHKADGGMRDALSMFDKAVSFCGNTLNYKDVAATLNVLDYDTYFTVTDLLLAGNYVDTLLLFDEVLSRGFSPQVFLSGLNAHMRDLLMAKGPAITLVEFTGTLVERYKAQAQKCDEALLFGAISLLTEADGKIRQSSNQRLLVELGLMKIAGLGQKKNEGIGFDCFESFDTIFELPDFVGGAAEPTPRVGVATAEGSSGVASAAIGAVQGSQGIESQSDTTQMSSPTARIPNTAASVPEQGNTRRPTVTTRAKTSSISLNRMLGGDIKSASEMSIEESAKQERNSVEIDPQCEEKLNLAKDKIVEALLASRPRIGSRFEESMTIEGNTVRIEVQSKELYNEIMLQKSDLQKLFSQQSGARGYIELDVVINEKIKVTRPITLEDRLQYLLSRNDRLAEMLELLGLDAE
jgi:DNA polymerase-3 subunit gamma/tau